jgi:peptidoglycan/xylan/chitin deacetylase (PgdA/CDA1 family)
LLTMIAAPMDDPTDRREELLARRERQRAGVRRRRIAAAASLIVVVLAASAVALVALGGDSGSSGDRQSRQARSDPGQGSESASAGPVRNASPQPDWGPHTGPVPIIEYHVLGPAPADAPYPELYVSRPDFHRQMDWLDRHGYEAVTLEQVQDAWYRHGALPPKPIVISFDDGYRPQFTYALPELRKHGWAGLLNLKAEGSELYESNVEAMLDAGWELASHTIDHSDLTTLEGPELEREVAESRRILRHDYGVPVKNFCYPAGRFDESVIAAVEAAGYEGATTEIPGYAESDTPFELARLEVLGSSGVEGLAAMLASG